MPCQFLKTEGKGIFSKGVKKCAILGTTIPDVRVTKYCENDWFGCEAFRDEMSSDNKK